MSETSSCVLEEWAKSSTCFYPDCLNPTGGEQSKQIFKKGSFLSMDNFLNVFVRLTNTCDYHEYECEGVIH